MTSEHRDEVSERVWKHRFAQALYEFFYMGGLERDAALEDAYAHADVQYLVRSLASPEDDARSALIWIRADQAVLAAGNTHSDAHATSPQNNARRPHNGARNPHDGAHHIFTTLADLPK